MAVSSTDPAAERVLFVEQADERATVVCLACGHVEEVKLAWVSGAERSKIDVPDAAGGPLAVQAGRGSSGRNCEKFETTMVEEP